MMRNNTIDGLQKKLIDEHCKISDKNHVGMFVG